MSVADHSSLGSFKQLPQVIDFVFYLVIFTEKSWNVNNEVSMKT